MEIESFVDLKEWAKIEHEVETAVRKAIPFMTLTVAENVLQLINESGNVPVGTGRLKNSTVVTNDKKDNTAHIIGWVGVPYASRRYYGFGAKRKRYIDDQNRKKSHLVYTSGGKPFWDREVTNNEELIERIYLMAARKAMKYV